MVQSNLLVGFAIWNELFCWRSFEASTVCHYWISYRYFILKSAQLQGRFWTRWPWRSLPTEVFYNFPSRSFPVASFPSLHMHAALCATHCLGTCYGNSSIPQALSKHLYAYLYTYGLLFLRIHKYLLNALIPCSSSSSSFYTECAKRCGILLQCWHIWQHLVIRTEVFPPHIQMSLATHAQHWL